MIIITVSTVTINVIIIIHINVSITTYPKWLQHKDFGEEIQWAKEN